MPHCREPSQINKHLDEKLADTCTSKKKTSFPNESNLSKTERFFKIVSAAIEFPSKKIIGGHESDATKLTFRVLFSWGGSLLSMS